MAEHPAVAFLRQAHERAEKLARAAAEPDGPAWTHNADDLWLITGTELLSVVVYDEGKPTNDQAAHMALHDPAAVLRRIAAERQILAEHAPGGMAEERDETECCTCSGPAPGFSGTWPAAAPCRTVLLLAEAWGWTAST